MSFRTIKIKWAKKLLKAKYFVIMTDKESAIALDAANPNTFTDILALTAQAAELQMFHDSLGELVAEHNLAIQKLTGVSTHELKKEAKANNNNAGQSKTKVRTDANKKAKSTKKVS